MFMFISNSSAPARNKCMQKQLIMRLLSLTPIRLQQGSAQLADSEELKSVNDEWQLAKDFNSIPGPSSALLLAGSLPGGRYHNLNMLEWNKKMRQDYGDIFKINGMLGKPNIVCTYNPKDFANVYRNEGSWPIRIGLESFTYYRKVKRPDIFKGVGGLVSEQGKAWGEIRNKVNPILMKVQTVRQNLPEIDRIACEFLDKVRQSHDPKTNLLNINFFEELKMWSFESISFVALNKRLGLLRDSPDANAKHLAKNMGDFFDLSYKYDVLPSIWQYYETPGFKKFLQTYDNITKITINYIEEAVRGFSADQSVEVNSVLEKLYRIDDKIAVVMAIDMLMAGIDTTTSAFTTTLYKLATNPDKQTLLRDEIFSILPNEHAPLTEENTRNLPYLRACIKESLRFVPITPGNFRMAARDLVLSGYQVPEGTGVMMNVMALSNTDDYFPRSQDFLPERWLKSGENACPAAKSKNPFVYLPFGFGPRTCIGKRIAEMEIETMLIRLLRKYQVTWASEKPLQYKSDIILTPCGDIKFKFAPI